MTEKERLEIQAQSFEFYAGLIERAVGRGAPLPVWGPMTAEDYRQQAQEYRRRAALLPDEKPKRTQQASTPNNEASVPIQKSVPSR